MRRPTLSRSPRFTLLRRLLLPAMLLLPSAGCASTPRATTERTPVVEPSVARSLPIFDGTDGSPITWPYLLDRCAMADVVILGETHTDPAAHAFQLAVVEALLERGEPMALCLEMLERDEQLVVDDYVEGIIDRDDFAKLTRSSSWRGWSAWYQPIVDAARAAGAPVIAANAPRRYVRLARTDGYERLEALPAQRRALFAIPPALPEGTYRERFWEIMGAGDDDDGDDGDTDEGAESADTAHADARMESIFRAQLVWDATMAESVVRAVEDGADPAVLLVGHFHSDFEGGTVLEIRRRRPDLDVVVVSLLPFGGGAPRAEDAGRGAVVVYTGE